MLGQLFIPTSRLAEKHVAGGKGLLANNLLVALFPQASAALETYVKSILPQVLDSCKPAWIEGIELQQFSIGSAPPEILEFEVQTASDEACSKDPSKSQLQEVCIKVSVRWISDADILLNVKPLPSATRSFLPTFMDSTIQKYLSVCAGIQKIEVSGEVLISLTPLLDHLPVVGGVRVTLTDAPHLDFKLVTLKAGSDDSYILDLLKPWLVRTLHKSLLGPLVMPEHKFIPLQPGAADVQRPKGVLLTHIIRAGGRLPSQDFLTGIRHPYCTFWVRQKVVHRTQSKEEEQPGLQWNHEAKLLVHDKSNQHLMMEVWDDNTGKYVVKADTFIGSCFLKLKDVPDDRELKVDLPLSVDHIDTGDPSDLLGDCCPLEITVQWIPSTRLSEHPALGHPGCVQVNVSKLWTQDASIFPVSFEVKLLGLSKSTSKKYNAEGTSAKYNPEETVSLNAAEYNIQQQEIQHKVSATAAPSFEIVFDVVGLKLPQIEASSLEIYVLGGRQGDPQARLVLAMSEVMQRRVAAGVSGGTYKLSNRFNTTTASVEVWWKGVLL
ncbi:hypothetical protein CEUSTIGMA_g7521.t1 [Chlamydomonas eustigma]|uniref:Uncharacterized protein n=1 Tax=Chlamydomonas eustigma TaxID=1157962 RepID=A0A250XAE0_9CHLO|nr:hypothetical protein CEUSTIGMA_g7521.t1 [Chlamydomonas eustigma]|eukprot:GAX80083.1 hypothetical protein CEUSTIGMA_g7521.t1 [Chlamydomonas eustigma]